MTGSEDKVGGSGAAQLEVSLPDGRTFIHEITHDQTNLGRGEQCELRIDDDNVSRLHAVVSKRADGYWVTDLGSLNGVVVNGTQVESAPLKDGDRVALGTSNVVFHQSAPVATEPPEVATAAQTGAGERNPLIMFVVGAFVLGAVVGGIFVYLRGAPASPPEEQVAAVEPTKRPMGEPAEDAAAAIARIAGDELGTGVTRDEGAAREAAREAAAEKVAADAAAAQKAASDAAAVAKVAAEKAAAEQAAVERAAAAKVVAEKAAAEQAAAAKVAVEKAAAEQAEVERVATAKVAAERAAAERAEAERAAAAKVAAERAAAERAAVAKVAAEKAAAEQAEVERAAAAKVAAERVAAERAEAERAAAAKVAAERATAEKGAAEKAAVEAAAVSDVATAGGELTGRQIMDEQKRRHTVKAEYVESVMILVDDTGTKERRMMKNYTREMPDGQDRSLIVFIEPAKVRGTALLTWEQEERDDDQWLYLPSQKKLQRIAQGSKRSYFMGTDFTYEDNQSEQLDDYQYTVLRSDTFEGQECWVLESIPVSPKRKKESGYSKRIIWVRKDIYFSVKVEYFDRRGRAVKTQTNHKLVNVGGEAWRPDQTLMDNYDLNHKTLRGTQSRKINPTIDAAVFTERYLKAERHLD